MTENLNDYVKKIKSGNLYCIAARPLIGKTTVARNIANMAAKNRKKVLYILTEDACKIATLRYQNDKYDFLYRRLISAEEIRNIAFIGKYDTVIIDSFQYMYKKRNEDTAYKLKRFAEELNIAVIALSHISRKADFRENHQPIISDMTRKMCGSLWKSSDNVLFLWRDAYYKPYDAHKSYETDDNICFLIAKDLISGDSGFFELDFKELLKIWNYK